MSDKRVKSKNKNQQIIESLIEQQFIAADYIQKYNELIKEIKDLKWYNFLSFKKKYFNEIIKEQTFIQLHESSEPLPIIRNSRRLQESDTK